MVVFTIIYETSHNITFIVKNTKCIEAIFYHCLCETISLESYFQIWDKKQSTIFMSNPPICVHRSMGPGPRAKHLAQFMNKILFFQHKQNNPQMAWNIEKSKDFILPFFLQAWARVWNEIYFSVKNVRFPKCPETSKKAKIFVTLFLWAQAWRKMFSGTDHMLQGTGPILWEPVPWSATQM